MEAKSIYIGDIGVPDTEAHSGLVHRAVSQPQGQAGSGGVNDNVDESYGSSSTIMNNGFDSKEEDDALDPIQLPPSTHSLLFSENVNSIPFGFGLVILSISFTCLGLAFVNNWTEDDYPYNVSPSVRAAQYLSILIALLMEEGE